MERLFKIGEISRLYHIGADSLRYYERLGLICPRRTESGYRLYSDREIWRLNVIRDLRELGFSMEAIGQYLDFQNTDTAVRLLEEELEAIRRKLQVLEKLRKDVGKRVQTIRIARQLPLNEIRLQAMEERRCYRMEQGYDRACEMDILIKELVNRSGGKLSIIGSNQFGSVIPLEQVLAGSTPAYRSVLAIDPRGDSTIAGGTFLTLCYSGGYGATGPWLRRLLDRAQAEHMEPAGDALELLWIDNHTTQEPGEYVTELQLPVREKGLHRD